MLRRSLWLAAAVLLTLVHPLAAQPHPADEAYAAGDQTRALQLYNQVLEADPSNVHALLRSAALLSWSKQFDEAVARYDRVLKLRPNDTAAMLERAKVLSWARRYPEAAEAFSRILQQSPDNRDARLGLARTLSWSADQRRARAEYTALVKKDSKDVDALVGVAQTHAWSGEPAAARQWYERALAVDPTSVAARIGRAYVDLESDRAAAVRASDELAREHPSNSDVAELREAVRRAQAPQFEMAHEVLSDSDNNALGVSRLRASMPTTAGQLSFTIARHAMDDRLRSGSVSAAHAVFSRRISPRTALRVRGGVDRVTASDGRTSDKPTGGISWSAGSEGKTLAVLSADRDVFKYSVPILDNGITYDTYAARLTSNAGRFSVQGGAAWAEFSDANARISGDAALLMIARARRVRFTTGYVFRYLDYASSMGNGYFDPQDYASHAVQLGVGGEFGASRGFYSISAEFGTQSFSFRGVETSGDQFTGGTVTVGVPLGSMLLFELSANKSNAAINAASGFESEQFAATLRIRR
jgi:tetratricopeptide (TPR) repeat protein